MFKKIAATASLCLMSCVTFAADGGDWNGFYAGVNAGYAWNDTKIRYGDTMQTLITGSFSGSKDNSFTAGGQIGYQQRAGSLVYGVEADFNLTDLDRRRNVFEDYGYAYDNYRARSQVDWFGTVRGRLGTLVQERTQAYLTGGLAYGRVKSASSFTVTYPGAAALDGTVAGRRSDTRMGWALGAGLEHAVSSTLSARVEYLYVDLGAKKYDMRGAYWDGAPIRYSVRDEARFSLLRAGVNYRF